MDFRSHEIGPDGVERVECGPIRFRSEDQLRAMLNEAGLVVDEVFGGYHGEPVGHGVGTLTITAHRP